MDATEYVNAIFAGGEGWVVVWRLPNRDAVWFKFPLDNQGAEKLRALVERWNSTAEGVYACMTLQREALPRPSRGTAANAVGSSVLWVDVDLHDPVAHKSEALPRTIEDVEEALLETGLPPPSIKIHSGHGLYLLWLLDAFAPAEHLASAVANVQARLARVWSARGWTLDNTTDLARVLRLPGTTNRKTHPGKPVRVLGEVGPRYPLSAFTQNGSTRPGPAASGELVIREGQRNVLLTSLAGSLRRRGVSPEALEAALLAINRVQCDPPLPENEVKTIAKSVGRYEPEPGEQGLSEQGLGEQGLLTKLVDLAAWVAEAPPVEWLWEGLLYRGGVFLLAGPPKRGKSTLLNLLLSKLVGPTELALRVRNELISIEDGTFLGRRFQVWQRVLLITENAPQFWEKRLVPSGVKVLSAFEVRRAGVEELTKVVGSGLFDVVAIDSLDKAVAIRDENDNAEWAAKLAPLLEAARASNCALILVHHHRKRGGSGGEEIRGGTGLFGSVDEYWSFTAMKAGGDVEEAPYLTCSLEPSGRVCEPVAVFFDMTLNEAWLPKKEEKSTRHAQVLMVLETLGEPVSGRELAKMVPIPHRTLMRLLDELVKEGVVVKEGGKGKEGGLYRLARLENADSNVPNVPN